MPLKHRTAGASVKARISLKTSLKTVPMGPVLWLQVQRSFKPCEFHQLSHVHLTTGQVAMSRLHQSGVAVRLHPEIHIGQKLCLCPLRLITFNKANGLDERLLLLMWCSDCGSSALPAEENTPFLPPAEAMARNFACVNKARGNVIIRFG